MRLLHFNLLRVASSGVRAKSLRTQYRPSLDCRVFTINYPFISIIGVDILAEIDGMVGENGKAKIDSKARGI